MNPYPYSTLLQYTLVQLNIAQFLHLKPLKSRKFFSPVFKFFLIILYILIKICNWDFLLTNIFVAVARYKVLIVLELCLDIKRMTKIIGWRTRSFHFRQIELLHSEKTGALSVAIRVSFFILMYAFFCRPLRLPGPARIYLKKQKHLNLLSFI